MADNQWIHQWIYVIIPVDQQVNPHFSRPYLCGFCKNCRKAFTLQLNYGEIYDKALFTETNIPKYGCTPPEMPGAAA